MTSTTVIALLLSSAILAHATPRQWHHTDGRGLLGEFLSRDSTTVTIRHSNGKELNLPIDKLTPDDRSWLNLNHPLAAPGASDTPTVFDQLSFGDTRDQVVTKLKASTLVELTVAETLLGRSGINGMFHTRQKIGGLGASLFFDWSESGGMKELSLQTDTLPASSYQSALKPSWLEFSQLLTTLYGQPIQKSPLPACASLADGSFTPSHMWALDGGGTARLGTARDGDQYQVVVRFSPMAVQPVATTDVPPSL